MASPRQVVGEIYAEHVFKRLCPQHLPVGVVPVEHGCFLTVAVERHHHEYAYVKAIEVIAQHGHVEMFASGLCLAP